MCLYVDQYLLVLKIPALYQNHFQQIIVLFWGDADTTNEFGTTLYGLNTDTARLIRV